MSRQAEPRSCVACGREFTPTYKRRAARFCSRPCALRTISRGAYTPERAEKIGAALRGRGLGRTYRKLRGRHDDVLKGKYLALGSVEGWLEAISIHREMVFSIYEPVHGKKVRCYFNRKQFEDAKAALGHRVIVAGMVLSSPRGHPVNVKVDAFELLAAPGDTPTVDDISSMGATDFTGGLEASRYIRERWDGD